MLRFSFGISVVSTLTLTAAALVIGIAHGQQPVPSTISLPPGEGQPIVERTCSQCHALGLALAKRYTADEWRQILAKMVTLGAPLDATQMNTVQTYLSSNFAPSNEGPESAVANTATVASQHYPRPEGPNQWPAYGGGGANTNYSTLTQITPANVAKLKPAWTYRYGAGEGQTGDMGLDYRFEVTPLIVGGIMYFSTPAWPNTPQLKSTVTALDPTLGRVVWKYESPVNIHGRGLAYWPGDETTTPRLIFGTDGGMIVALDMTTGQPARGFGRNGQIDAYVGVVSEIVGESRRRTFTIPNPVTIWKNVIITGSRPGEVGPPAPRGDIRGWDARSGRLLWTFHTVPEPGEPNHDAYSRDEWRDVSGANVWSTMAVDEELGIVYAPTGDGNTDAKGSHLYANTLLALDAASGKLLWHRQITHRDIWDWDLPTPPVLIDYDHQGTKVPAVLLTGKQGLVFIFDRRSGAPLNGFEERPTPQPNPRSDSVWPTQPFPTAPGPIARTQMTRDEIPDLVPGMRAACQKIWDENDVVSVPLYGARQSSEHATVSYPGPTGGPNWGGGAYNSDLGYYFINLQNRASYRPKAASGAGVTMMARTASTSDAPRPARRRGAPQFSYQIPDGRYLSCGATPWGELVAVDVKKLKIAWRAPLGMTAGLGKAGEHTGTSNLGGSLATKSGLVFIGAANDRRLRAFDARSGRKLWETQLEASAHATPITYMGSDGKQYIVVAAAGGTSVGGPETSDTLVAYRLP